MEDATVDDYRKQGSNPVKENCIVYNRFGNWATENGCLCNRYHWLPNKALRIFLQFTNCLNDINSNVIGILNNVGDVIVTVVAAITRTSMGSTFNVQLLVISGSFVGEQPRWRWRWAEESGPRCVNIARLPEVISTTRTPHICLGIYPLSTDEQWDVFVIP